MTHTLIFGFDEQLSRWACERIPWAIWHNGIRAVGVADGDGPDAKLMAVITYSNYYPPKMIDGREWYGTVEMGIAAATPRWATRRTIVNLLSIAFCQYKVRKVRLLCPSTNKRAIRFAEGIGFKPEGTLRHEYADGVHACVLGLLRKEFERPDFLKRKKAPKRSTQAHIGQEHTVTTASA
jgi:RimJ/RimL family protein N-acetyltransferase